MCKHLHKAYLEDKLCHILLEDYLFGDRAQLLQEYCLHLQVLTNLVCSCEQGISIHSKDYHNQDICEPDLQLEFDCIHHKSQQNGFFYFLYLFFVDQIYQHLKTENHYLSL
jgi:hypothetical protein